MKIKTDTTLQKINPKEFVSKCDANDVKDAFNCFLRVYDRFREDNGLKDKDNNPFELCTALMDKTGRIARQIKHFQRNDPKKDWPEGMTEAMTGFIVYLILILKQYKISIDEGMINELNSAVGQYSKMSKK